MTVTPGINLVRTAGRAWIEMNAVNVTARRTSRSITVTRPRECAPTRPGASSARVGRATRCDPTVRPVPTWMSAAHLPGMTVTQTTVCVITQPAVTCATARQASRGTGTYVQVRTSCRYRRQVALNNYIITEIKIDIHVHVFQSYKLCHYCLIVYLQVRLEVNTSALCHCIPRSF